MKKLAIVQIILGALVVGSLMYWLGWISSGYHIREAILPDGYIVQELPMVPPNPALTFWSILLYPVLGLAVLGYGIAQYFEIGGKQLAVAQIVLGVLIISSLVWFISWVERDYGPCIRVMEPYGEIEMKYLPGWEMRLTIWKIACFILGLSVAGTAIVQKVKMGRHEAGN